MDFEGIYTIPKHSIQNLPLKHVISISFPYFSLQSPPYQGGKGKKAFSSDSGLLNTSHSFFFCCSCLKLRRTKDTMPFPTSWPCFCQIIPDGLKLQVFCLPCPNFCISPPFLFLCIFPTICSYRELVDFAKQTKRREERSKILCNQKITALFQSKETYFSNSHFLLTVTREKLHYLLCLPGAHDGGLRAKRRQSLQGLLSQNRMGSEREGQRRSEREGQHKLSR